MKRSHGLSHKKENTRSAHLVDKSPNDGSRPGGSAKNGGRRVGNTAKGPSDLANDDSLADFTTLRQNDLASPNMQRLYYEQLKDFSLRHMYSRAGKNTRNNHFEFM